MAEEQQDPGGGSGTTAKAAPDADKKLTSEDVMQKQQRTLCEQFVGLGGREGDAQIGVQSLELFTFRGYLFGGQIASLPGVAREDAFVWSRGEGDHELWVKSEQKGTPGAGKYGTYWNTFCKDFFGVEWNISGKRVNIDHLFPETAGTLQGLAYIRLLPVSAEPNRAQSALEKQMVAREKEINQASPGTPRKPVRHATPETLAKVTGFEEWIILPENRDDFTDIGLITRLVDHVRRHVGIHEPDVLRQLMVQMTQYGISDKQTPLDKRAAKRAKWEPFIP